MKSALAVLNFPNEMKSFWTEIKSLNLNSDRTQYKEFEQNFKGNFYINKH
jgi:hypothetical protein